MTVYTLESHRYVELAQQTYIVLTVRNNKTNGREDLSFKYYDYCFIETSEAHKIVLEYKLRKIDGYRFYEDDILCSKVYFNSTSIMKSILSRENVSRANLIYLKPDRKFLIDTKIKYKFILNTKKTPINPRNIFALSSDVVDNPNTIYCDIEVDSEGDIQFPSGDNAIHPVISISYVCTNWDMYWTVLNPKLKNKSEQKVVDFNDLKLHVSEKSLEVFNSIIDKIDPNKRKVTVIEFQEESDLIIFVGNIQSQYESYVITGWNFLRFDSYYLIGRCKILKIPKGLISINGQLNHAKTHDDMGRDVIRVWTSECYFIDSLDAFLKYYPEKLKYNDLSSVSAEVIGPEFGKFDMGISIRKAYHTNKDLLLVYNMIDTILVKMIDDKIRLLAFYELRRKEKGLDISKVFSTIGPIDAALLYFAEKERVALPDIKERNRGGTLTGANVFTEEANIFPYGFMVDFRSEYPSIAASLNCSRRTLVKDKSIKALLNKAYYQYKKSGYKNKNPILNNYTVAPGEKEKIWFDNTYDCFEKKFLMERFVLREKYAKIANQYDFDSLDYLIYHAYEQDKKLDGNSFYGALANVYFRLGHIECSRAITSTGRQLLDHQRDFTFTLGFKIGISDTDSADIVTENDKLTPVEAVKQGYEIKEKMADEIDDYVQKAFLFGSKNGIRKGFDQNEDNTDTHWIFAKFEQLFHPLLTTGKKKFYAFKLIWKDGKFLKEPKYKVKGLPCIKRDSPQIFRDAQFGLVKHLLDQGLAFKPLTVKYLKSFKRKMMKSSPEYLSSSASYKKEIWQYKQVAKGYLPPIGAQAMCNSMANLGIQFEPISRFKVLRIKRIKKGKYNKKEIILNGTKIKFNQHVVAYNDEEELPDDFFEYFAPDYNHLYKKVIIEKNKIFLKMLGIDPIVFTGQKQLTDY